MNILFDTCVLIDALQDRKPFNIYSKELVLLCANREINGFVTAKSLADIYYLSHKLTHSNSDSRDIIEMLFKLFNILPTTNDDLYRAISSPLSDFEDAVMVETAKREKMNCIVTHNEKDYINSSIPIFSPEKLVQKIELIP